MSQSQRICGLFALLAFCLAAPLSALAQDTKTAPAKDSPAEAAADADAPAEEQEPATGEEAAEPTDAADEAAAGEEADEEEAGTEEKSWLAKMAETGALALFLDGGVFMYPLLILGIIAGGVMIERYRSLMLLRSDSGQFRREVFDLLHDDKVEEAYARCQSEQGPVPAILGSGLRKFLVLRRLNYDPAKIEEQVIKAMDDYSVHIVAALERHLPIVATVSSVAPMLGFLGTVQGMIVAFQNINDNIGQANIVQLAAGGISVSLLTTCFGLIIGIPSFMAFNYFTGVINRFVLEVEESAAELIEVVTLQMALREPEGVQSSDGEATHKPASQQEAPVAYQE